MPIMVRLEDDLVEYFKEHGKFGETHSDVLRRLLPGFQQSKLPPAQAGMRNNYPTVFGHALTNVVRALGAEGWSEAEATKALQLRLSQSVNPAMVKTQIAWGKQWRKGNPLCKQKKRPYGSEPPKLTSDQLAELREVCEAAI